MTVDYDVKPVLKWVGGKRQLVPDIREFYKSNLDFLGQFK